MSIAHLIPLERICIRARDGRKVAAGPKCRVSGCGAILMSMCSPWRRVVYSRVAGEVLGNDCDVGSEPALRQGVSDIKANDAGTTYPVRQ